MKIQQTKRKFYNKWLYKITLKISGSLILRNRAFDRINESSDVMLISFVNLLSNIDKSNYALRVEGKITDFYTNDLDVYKQILIDFNSIIKTAFEPGESTKHVLDNPKTVVAKKYPHNKYKFKVFLQPHKIKDVQEKEKYVNWLEGQNPRVLITETVKTWFVATNWNWDRRYIYIEDENTLLLVKLRNSEAVGSVYSYVIDDK